MKVYNKPEEYEARQFIGHGEPGANGPELAGWARGRYVMEAASASDMAERIMLDLEKVRPGDWIITPVDGFTFGAVTKSEFERRFAPLGGGTR